MKKKHRLQRARSEMSRETHMGCLVRSVRKNPHFVQERKERKWKNFAAKFQRKKQRGREQRKRGRNQYVFENQKSV